MRTHRLHVWANTQRPCVRRNEQVQELHGDRRTDPTADGWPQHQAHSPVAECTPAEATALLKGKKPEGFSVDTALLR